MKLIAQYNDEFDASDKVSRLEGKGIAVHITGRRSSSLSKSHTGTTKVGLWVVLESQYADAEALFKNSKHKVTTGISQKQISIIKKQVNSGSLGVILKNMIFMMLLLMGAIGSYIYFF